MKKLFSVAIIALFNLNCAAQLVLTASSNSPVPGVRSSQVYDSMATMPRSVGLNQTWDFSKLTKSQAAVKSFSYCIPGNICPIAQASANLAGSEGSLCAYYLGNSSQFVELGFSYHNFNQSDRKIMIWPFTYGDSFSSECSTKTSKGWWGQYGYTMDIDQYTVTATGRGDLKLPGGQLVNDVLQISTSTNHTQINSNGASSFSVTYRNQKYEYYSADYRYPMLTVEFMYINKSQQSNGFPDTTVSILLNPDFPTALQENSLDQNLRVFPNPAKEILLISYPNTKLEESTLEIYSTLGTFLRRIEVPDTSEVVINIPLIDMATGVYFVKVTVGDKQAVKRIVITK